MLDIILEWVFALSLCLCLIAFQTLFIRAILDDRRPSCCFAVKSGYNSFETNILCKNRKGD